MNPNNFKLLNKIENTNDEIFNFIDNLPRKEMVVRNNIKSACFNLIRNCNIYNLYRDKSKVDRNDVLIDILVDISMLNYYLSYIFDKHYLNKKEFNKISGFLREERMMTYGLIKYNKV